MTRTNQPTQVPALPKLPADTPPALRRYLELLEQTTNIRLGRRGDPRDRAITLRELISSGLAKELKEKPFDPNTADAGFVSSDTNLADLAVPPAPTGFSVTGAFSIINMSWNDPGYSNHSHTEVYVHTSDSLGSATLLGITGSRVFSDPVGSGQTRYYWIRHVNTSGVPGPYNSGTGTVGQTATDVTHMLNLLNGAITSSQLAQSLSDPIGNLPADTQQSITNAQNTLQNNIDAIFTEVAVHSTSRAYSVGEIVRAGASDTKLYICIQAISANSGTALTNTSFWKLYGDYDSLKTSTDTSAAAITQINNLNSNTTSASAQAVRGLRSAVYTNGDPSQGVILASAAAVSQLETEVFGATGGSINASASRIDGLVTEVFDGSGNSRLATASALTALETEVFGSGSASSSRIDALDAILFDNSGNAVVSATNLSTMKSGVLNTDGTLRASASQLDQLTASYTDPVSGNQTSSLSQALETSASNVNGLRASYAVKVDLNGAVAGFGLASTANAAGNIVSEFIVNADRFAIMRGGSDSTAAVTPFTVQATQTTINGETVPAGVYMTDAFIKNGSIVSAKIGSLAVDKISGSFAELGTVLTGFLDGDKIEANSLDAGRITTDTLNVAGKSIVDSIGRISGTSGENESDNGQNITITELVRSIYGANGKPKHIVGATSSSHSPSVSIGDVLGGSPRFSHNFTTFNFTGNRDFIIQAGLDFTGSTSSSSESIFAVAMRATNSSSNFTSSTASDYVFTEKISSSGSHAVGFHALNARVQLNPNTEYYIWCFALGDDGVTSYKSGFISVFGLNK